VNWKLTSVGQKALTEMKSLFLVLCLILLCWNPATAKDSKMLDISMFTKHLNIDFI